MYATGTSADMYTWGTPVVKYAASEAEFRYLSEVDPEVSELFNKSPKSVGDADLYEEFRTKGMSGWWDLVRKYKLPKDTVFKMLLR